MSIYFANQQYSKLYASGFEVSQSFFNAQEFPIKSLKLVHTFSIVSGGRGNTRGYNAVANWGRLATGSMAAYSTPGGKNVTVIHARRLNQELIFALGGSGYTSIDFPRRVIATRGTNVAIFVPHMPEQIRNIDSGVRKDYDIETGDATNVFVSNRETQIQLFY